MAQSSMEGQSEVITEAQIRNAEELTEFKIREIQTELKRIISIQQEIERAQEQIEWSKKEIARIEKLEHLPRYYGSKVCCDECCEVEEECKSCN